MIKSLEEKYKKKCEQLKKANKKINELEELIDRSRHLNHIIQLEHIAMSRMLAHVELNKYEVCFKNENGNTYTEKNVFSFNKRTIKTALCKAISKRTAQNYYTFQVREIISVKEVD